MLDPQRRVPVAFLWLWAAIWVALVTVGPFVLWWRFRTAALPRPTTGLPANRMISLPEPSAAPPPLGGLPTRQVVVVDEPHPSVQLGTVAATAEPWSSSPAVPSACP